MDPFALARNHATPVLLLDPSEAARNVTALRAALPGVEVWYAYKCNPHPSLAAALARLGVGFEVASPGEVRDLLALGVPGDRMMCLHTIKSPDFLRLLHDIGVRVLAVDSLEEVDRVAEFAPHSRVVARIEIPDPGSRVPLGDKFGCSPGEAVHLLDRARRLGLDPAGITTHVGSQCESPAGWDDAVRLCGEVVADLDRRGVRAAVVSLGGGLPVRYTPGVPTVRQVCEVVSAALDRHGLRAGRRVTIEPGRAVAASAGMLVASVLGTATRGGVCWVYLDAGVYHGLFEALPVAGGFTFPVTVEHPSRPVRRCRLAGPTCDSLDVLPGEFHLPELRAGDRVAFRFAGAYSTSLATSFNGFDAPRVVVKASVET